MKVSVITVCYNAVRSIERTIKSVKEQEYPDLEYIVIDGGSTDGTVDVIRRYSNLISYWISEPDKGIYDAMNKGLDHAAGDWIIYMNSGDLFVNKYVIQSVFSKPIGKHIGVIFGSTIANGKIMDMTPFIYSSRKLKSMGICHQSIFVRTAIARRIGFDLTFKVAADYDMIMRIYKLGYKFLDVKKPISIFDKNGFSSYSKVLQLKEEARICRVKSSPMLKILQFLKWIKQIYNKIIHNS